MNANLTITDTIQLTALADEINREHDLAERAAHTAVSHALKAGGLLIQAKAACQHGEWLPWLREHCRVSERTAQAYMRLAKELPKLDDSKAQRVADLSLREALSLLTHSEYGGHELHDAAKLFPAMNEREFGGLCNSVKTHGVIIPITLYQGKILDGKERMRACVVTGTEPAFREYEGNDPIGYVWSMNGIRMHLGDGQKATIAVDAALN